jgi:hypothetical protein
MIVARNCAIIVAAETQSWSIKSIYMFARVNCNTKKKNIPGSC